MCGRFVLMTPARSLARHFELAEEPELEPRYNIAPTQLVAVIRWEPDSAQRELILQRWGLIPSWAKDPSIAAKLINARAETVAQKPAFKAAFRRRRCLVPADGFYEWRNLSRDKQPYYFGMASREPLAFAGLWERWKNPEGELIESCTIITTVANELLAPIHDRMPAIVKREDYATWLDPGVEDQNRLTSLLGPYPAKEMTGFPVSQGVNRSNVEGPDLVELVKMED
jgi:putative SOS response-associated peptidase YedK